MQFWQKTKEKLSALSTREKSIIFFSGIVLVLYLGALQLVEPAWKRLQKAQQGIALTDQQVESLQQQITLTQALLEVDPDQEIDLHISALEQRDHLLDNTMRERVGHLVTPPIMAEVIEQAFRKAERVTLLSFRSLPARQLVAPAEGVPQDDVDEQEQATVRSGDEQIKRERSEGYYIHPFEIQLEGRYVDIYEYLTELEQLPVVFYWESFDYQVSEYPNAKLTLVVYTLGPREVFISG